MVFGTVMILLVYDTFSTAGVLQKKHYISFTENNNEEKMKKKTHLFLIEIEKEKKVTKRELCGDKYSIQPPHVGFVT